VKPRGRVGAALGVGLVATLATAWGGVWVRPAYRPLGLARAALGRPIWQLDRAQRADRTTIRYWRMNASGISLAIPEADYLARECDPSRLPASLRAGPLDDRSMMTWREQSGFPLPALACAIDWVTQNNNIVTYAARGGILLPDDARNEPRALPLRPLWPGLIGDIAIWAGVWFGFTSGARRVIAWRRARRNRCTTCGYSRTGLADAAACPECGSPRDR
jgi:hypothetical protein